MSTEPYPLYCPECGGRIPPHADHCEHCHPTEDTTKWPVRGVIGMCAVYFFVVLIRTVFS